MSSDQPTFHEIILEGHLETVRALLLGVQIGSRTEGRLYFSHEESIEGPTISEKIRDFVGLTGPYHVVVDDTMGDVLRKSAERLADEGRVKIAETRAIRAAQFAFSYQAYARKYGEQIHELIDALPSGVEVHKEEPKETIEESAGGVEAYSPLHDYEIEGGGTVRGRVDLVLEAREKLTAHPLVSAEPVHLETS